MLRELHIMKLLIL